MMSNLDALCHPGPKRTLQEVISQCSSINGVGCSGTEPAKSLREWALGSPEYGPPQRQLITNDIFEQLETMFCKEYDDEARFFLGVSNEAQLKARENYGTQIAYWLETHIAQLLTENSFSDLEQIALGGMAARAYVLMSLCAPDEAPLPFLTATPFNCLVEQLEQNTTAITEVCVQYGAVSVLFIIVI